MRRSRLSGRTSSSLQHPVTVKFDGEDYTLTPKELKVRADVDGMVDEAVDVSREGDIFSRVWRYTTGGDVDTDVEPRVGYSNDSLQGFIDGVAAKIDREPQDATVEPTPTDLTPWMHSRESPCARTSSASVSRARSDRRTPVWWRPRSRPSPRSRQRPDERIPELPHDRPPQLHAALLRNLKLEEEYTIAVGAVGFDTPAGLYHIENKAVNPSWSVPNSDWTGGLGGQVIRQDRAIRSRRAGWGSSTARASTGPTTSGRWDRRLARLRADVGARRDRAVRQGRRRDSHLHLLAAGIAAEAANHCAWDRRVSETGRGPSGSGRWSVSTAT